jgi:hypothetical protein
MAEGELEVGNAEHSAGLAGSGFARH